LGAKAVQRDQGAAGGDLEDRAVQVGSAKLGRSVEAAVVVNVCVGEIIAVAAQNTKKVQSSFDKLSFFTLPPFRRVARMKLTQRDRHSQMPWGKEDRNYFFWAAWEQREWIGKIVFRSIHCDFTPSDRDLSVTAAAEERDRPG
jgi:hypothetical protein